MSIYAQVADVMAIAQQQGGYTATTVPTTTQVQGFLDQTEAEVETILNNVGYVVPVAAATGYPATRALKVLQLLVSLKAAALAVQTQDKGMEADGGEAASRSKQWLGEYESMLNDIAAGPLKLYDALPTTLQEDLPYQMLRSGSSEPENTGASATGGPSADGVTKQAFFTRSQVFALAIAVALSGAVR